MSRSPHTAPELNRPAPHLVRHPEPVAGTEYVLLTIYFAAGSAALGPAERSLLRQAAAYLNAHPTDAIRLTGHRDPSCTELARLESRRTDAVAKALRPHLSPARRRSLVIGRADESRLGRNPARRRRVELAAIAAAASSRPVDHRPPPDPDLRLPDHVRPFTQSERMRILDLTASYHEALTPNRATALAQTRATPRQLFKRLSAGDSVVMVDDYIDRWHAYAMRTLDVDTIGLEDLEPAPGEQSETALQWTDRHLYELRIALLAEAVLIEEGEERAAAQRRLECLRVEAGRGVPLGPREASAES